MSTTKQPINAAILTTDPGDAVLQQIMKVLKDAGFAKVTVLDRLPDAQTAQEGGRTVKHLPDELKDANLVIFDEQVGGRSGFELHRAMQGAVETPRVGFGIVLSRPTQETVFASIRAGFDMCWTKEIFDRGEFLHIAKEIVYYARRKEWPVPKQPPQYT